jgi:hypothetical protein
MNENEAGFNETQLKRVGMAEAYTQELREQMQKGVPVINHTFKKAYDDDKVTATLHLKKDAKADIYFLNRFDLELQRAGTENKVSQSFYISAPKPKQGPDGGLIRRPAVKYTLKEGYNLLSGRPVFKNLVNKEGNDYQAWVKLNFNKVLDNGQYQMKQYTHNYGYDLEQVLKNYPIKELQNEQYTKSLVDSLHRGNLQKVTFAGKDEQENRLYVSPNITSGSLNVYDDQKQRLHLNTLVEKGYITEALAQQIKAKVAPSIKKEAQGMTPSVERSLKEGSTSEKQQKELPHETVVKEKKITAGTKKAVKRTRKQQTGS